MSGSRVRALGVAVPEGRLTNEELAQRWGIDGAWILSRSGIRERRIAGATEDAATLGTLAAARALSAARIHADDIDMIVCATITPPKRFPAAGCLIGAALGTRAAAFDLNAGCSGFLFALAHADAAVRSGIARRVIVVGSDVMSRITDYDDPRSAILFGDGAGAAIVERSSSHSIGPFDLHADGNDPETLTVDRRGLVAMNGREVYRRAVAAMASSLSTVLARSGHGAKTVDLVVPHQANQRILDAVAEKAGLRRDQVFSNIELRGNTSAASIPLALHDAQEAGLLPEGARVALSAFGAGFCWGAAVLSWKEVLTTAPGSTEAVYA